VIGIRFQGKPERSSGPLDVADLGQGAAADDLELDLLVGIAHRGESGFEQRRQRFAIPAPT